MKQKNISSFDLIKLTNNSVELDDGIYYQIECIKTHKDSHYQRVINKGDLGGYVHIESIDYLQDKWIETNQVVGKVESWEGKPTKVKRERYLQSEYKNFYYEIQEHYSLLRLNNQTREPSNRNAVLTHAHRILDMVIEVVNYERKLDNIGFNNETHMIVLWSMIGAIQEGLLKMHILVYEKEYRDLRNKAKDNIWEEKTDNILRTLKKLNHISQSEMVILEKINNNRNMIHLLNFGSIFSYDEYRELVHFSTEVYRKLFNMTKEYND